MHRTHHILGSAVLAAAALWAASAAQATAFSIYPCKQLAHITKAECRDSQFRDSHTINGAHTLDSRRELQLLTEAVQHFATPVRAKMSAKLPASAPQLPLADDMNLVCHTYENSRRDLVKLLKEAFTLSCQAQGASCAFAGKDIWDVSVLRYAGEFYAVLSIDTKPGRESWLINQKFQRLSTLPYHTAFDPTTGILRMQGTSATYLQLEKGSAKTIASFPGSTPGAEQIEYEMNIDYDPRQLEAQCPMLIID